MFVIVGSASGNSANQKLVDRFNDLSKNAFNLTIYNGLKSLPHFDPELSAGSPPQQVVDFRNAVDRSDGVIICTPEYVFSIPSGLKNALEWCVSTTVFSHKPVGLITASLDGQKGHEELQLIMKTILSKFTDETSLLIRGVKGKINDKGEITDNKTRDDLSRFAIAYHSLLEDAGS